MSVTLEELLESSGINSLKGEEQEKTASDNAHSEDLVSELRKMAEAQPAPEGTKELAAQELAEKTAEIAVIAQTLSEIEKVSSLKIPKAHTKIATFIKVAMDAGHNEKDIASFLTSTKKASERRGLLHQGIPGTAGKGGISVVRK